MFGFGTQLHSNNPVSVPFSPIQVQGIHSYYSADVCTQDGSVATLVPDQGPNSEQAMTPVAAPPLYTPSSDTFNSLPSFSSYQAERRLQVSFNAAIAQPSTYYLVLLVPESLSGQIFWRTNHGFFHNSAGFSLHSDYTAIMLVEDSSEALTGGAISPGVYVSCAVYDYQGGTSALYLNDSTNAFMSSPNDGDLDGNSNTEMTIGTFSAVSYEWTAAAQYSGIHLQPQRQQLFQYFGSKYGIQTT